MSEETRKIGMVSQLQGLPDGGYVPVVDTSGSLKRVSVEQLLKDVRDSIEIGGRNLALKSNVEQSGKYPCAGYSLSEPIENGGKYVVTMEATMLGDTTFFNLWDMSGSVNYSRFTHLGGNIYRAIFTANTRDLTEEIRKKVAIFPNGTVEGNRGGVVTRIKLERGNIPTDWTPAPEDYLSMSGGGNLQIFNELPTKERRTA